MPVFAWRAAEGHGTLSAPSAREARDRLRERGLSLLDVRPVAGPVSGRAGPGASAFGGLVDAVRGPFFRFDLAGVARELATLLSVGVPVLEALETLSAGRSPRARAVIDALADRLRRGTGLAAAMRDPALSRHFDPLSVQLVEVGEQAGTLDAALDRVAAFRERRAQLRGRLASALAYPAVVATLAAFVSVFLMTRVVPDVLAPLVAQGRELPALTVAVKAVSDTLVEDGAWIAAAGVAAAAGALLLSRRPAARRAWSRWQLRLPLVGPLLHKQALCHVCVVLSTLLQAGIDFGAACALTARSCPQRAVGEALATARESVLAGSDIAEALEGAGRFPPTVVRAFSVGQRSGRLGPVLERLALTLDGDVERGTARLAGLLEPVLIVAVAVLVGVIAYATLIPILEASDAF